MQREAALQPHAPRRQIVSGEHSRHGRARFESGSSSGTGSGQSTELHHTLAASTDGKVFTW